MRKRLTQVAVALVLLFAAVQFIRPNRANPPIDPSRAIQARVPAELGAVLDRSCGDCHSYRTRWPSFTKVAPLSWLYSYA